jgi:cytochrome P450
MTPAENPDRATRELDLADPAFARRPQPVYARLHERCPVARATSSGFPVIPRYQDVLWALRHPEVFSSEMDVHLALGTERPMIPQQIDPPRQARFRKILDLQFSRKRVLALEPQLRRHARDLIEAFVADGRCEFMRAFAVPYPGIAFLRLMGLPLADLEILLEWKDAIIRPPGAAEAAAASRAKAGKQIYAYFERRLDERTGAAPGEDVLAHLLRAEIDGRPRTREEMLDIWFLFLLGGLDTVTATLGCSVLYLAENPEQRRRLVEAPERIPGAVEELLRWETPVMGVTRLVTQDIQLSGVDIAAGQVAFLLLGAADTDVAEFADATRVDFARERNPHLAFGGGPHRCLGSHLARVELRTALEELHRRIPDHALEPGHSPRMSFGIRGVQGLSLVWDTAP